MTAPPLVHRPDPDLLARLLAFELDDPTADAPLSRRVARDTGLDPEATRRAMLEYKRFVYLALTCEGGASPSELVDAVWHAHLLYTRNYWGPFTAMLGRPLHHEPSRGGKAERHRHDVWYARTLEAYRRAFGEPPPSSIWPAGAVSARRCSRPREVTWHAVRRRLIRLAVHVGGWARGWAPHACASALVLTSALAVLGCGGSLGPYDLPGEEFLFWYLVACVVAYVAGGRIAGANEEPPVTDAPIVDDRYELAMLAGGPGRVRDASLIALLGKRYVEAVVERSHITFRRREAAAVEHLPPFERAILARLPESGPEKLPNLSFRDEPLIADLRDSLVRRGLLRAESEVSRTGGRRALPLVFVALFGVGKVVVGMVREKPVAVLAFLVLLTLVVAVFRYGTVSRRTSRGDAAYQASERAAHRSFASLSADPITVPAALALGVAIEGFAHRALAQHDATRALHGIRQPVTNDGCGAGCGGGGGGCGGGDGGGGCGGCGGD